MRRADFRVAWRLMLQAPGYSLVAVMGLAAGLGAFLLLSGFARYSWSYDAQVPDVEHVYMIEQRFNLQGGTNWQDNAPAALREAAQSIPGVSASTGYLAWHPLNVQVDGHAFKLQSLTALPGFTELMGIRAIQGDLNEALTRPDAFAITESAARRLFGTSDVIGRAMPLNSVETKGVARIAAILPDPPANTTIPYESLNGVDLSLIPQMFRDEALHGQMGWPGHLLVRLHSDASVTAVTEALQNFADQAARRLGLPPGSVEALSGKKVIDIQLVPLREAYFDRDVVTDSQSLAVDRGDRKVIAGLLAIGGLILLLAAINYVNLATLRVIRRQREIGVRKVLGFGNRRLAFQFLAESMLVAVAAAVIGLVLAVVALPWFSELANRDLSGVLTPGNGLLALGVGVIVGALVSIYPAWIAFRVRPAQVLAGRPDTESPAARRTRQVFSVLQIAAAMGLASFTLAVAWQTDFSMHDSPGFDPTPLLIFEMNEGRKLQEDDTTIGLVAEMRNHPAVAGVTMSSDAVGRTRNPWHKEFTREGGRPAMVEVKEVTPPFFVEYGIRPIAGRLFDPALDHYDPVIPVVINELAAREFGFASPQQAVGATLKGRGAFYSEFDSEVVIGVAPEIRFKSLRDPPAPIVYQLFSGGMTVTVRARHSVADAEAAVRSVWPKYFPQTELQMTSAKHIFAANYADDAALARLLGLATLVAMSIAAIGAYVLAADAVQRRRREIALRKLFGARRRDVGRLVARELGVILLFATLIALPLASLAIARYLAPFIERTPLAYWAIGVALIAALGVVGIAAARQTRIAMAMKPSAALRG
jgi:cell division protein FtsX